MYKIGDFSKLVDVSISTLRYYDEINLLTPDNVDVYTGYRYYSKQKIIDITVIKELKQIGFSLEEIKENWDRFDNDLFMKKRQELFEKTLDINKNIKRLDQLRSTITNGKIIIQKKENI